MSRQTAFRLALLPGLAALVAGCATGYLSLSSLGLGWVAGVALARIELARGERDR